MNITRSNKPLVIVLVTAILFLQWSAQHFHLTAENDVGQHQHIVTVHQHQAASHHVDNIDVADTTHSHADNSKIVELNHVCTECQSKQLDKFVVILSSKIIYSKYSQLFRIVAGNDGKNLHQSYLQYTSIGLRAPPLIS